MFFRDCDISLQNPSQILREYGPHTRHALCLTKCVTQVDQLKPGEILQGKYLIREHLGDGASGTVYLAEHLVLSSEVAIKVLHPRFAENELMRRRFLDEARTLARLKSRYIVRILDADLAASGLAFIAMEYVGGSDLERYIGKNAPLAPAETLRIAIEICCALREAHENGIVHRDIKPENILLSEDAHGQIHVKVADFGLAKRVHLKLSRQSTSNDQPIGTPCYMAPEQMLTPAEVDHRADVFSVGVLLYEMLTGFLPFGGDTVEQTMQSVLSSEPPRASDLDERISPELSDLIERCLIKDPDARLGSIVQLMDEISSLQKGKSAVGDDRAAASLARNRGRRESTISTSAPAVVSSSAPQDTPRGSHRGVWISLGVAAAAALLAGGIVYTDAPVREVSMDVQDRVKKSLGFELAEDRLPTLPFTLKETPRSFHASLPVWREERALLTEAQGTEDAQIDGAFRGASTAQSQAPYIPVPEGSGAGMFNTVAGSSNTASPSSSDEQLRVGPEQTPASAEGASHERPVSSGDVEEIYEPASPPRAWGVDSGPVTRPSQDGI